MSPNPCFKDQRLELIRIKINDFVVKDASFFNEFIEFYRVRLKIAPKVTFFAPEGGCTPRR